MRSQLAWCTFSKENILRATYTYTYITPYCENSLLWKGKDFEQKNILTLLHGLYHKECSCSSVDDNAHYFSVLKAVANPVNEKTRLMWMAQMGQIQN
jgi:hypothetical protein